MYERIEDILSAPAPSEDAGRLLGESRGRRPIRGYRFGRGELRVSLLAGCHADEPVGPRLLRRLAGYLSRRAPDDPLLTRLEWWLLPHLNPDGAVRNRPWQDPDAERYDLARYLAGVVREEPGDDVEFGFPRGPDDEGARPENRAAWVWWRECGGAFHLHASLHGMALGAGPWFLVEAAWRNRCGHLKRECRRRTRELGYRLHDVERLGEKGFERLERGFATRPDSRAMRSYFMGRGDPDTARRFRPSSMEAIRALGGDPLTLVSEPPLFLAPGVGETLGPPDPALEEWKERFQAWRSDLGRGKDPDSVRREAREAGVEPMPVVDQMRLQWAMVAAGIEQLRRERTP